LRQHLADAVANPVALLAQRGGRTTAASAATTVSGTASGVSQYQWQVSINGGGGDMTAPFGGYKMSGNGREWGDYGFHEYLEVKAMLGYAPPKAAE